VTHEEAHADDGGLLVIDPLSPNSVNVRDTEKFRILHTDASTPEACDVVILFYVLSEPCGDGQLRIS
jgi:hypothetical protein